VREFSLSVEIAAPPARVWRALCDPAEVVVWDTGIERALDAPTDYPRAGQYVRWRYNNGPFRLLHDRPQEVVPERTLRSLLAVGPLRFDEAYTLDAKDAGCRLTAAMRLWMPIPVLGPLIERLYGERASRTTVGASLRAIKLLCESTP